MQLVPDSFSRTQDAYDITFSDDPEIPKILKGSELKEVCLIRTQLVHDAGIATAAFQKQTKKFTFWKDVPQGKVLPLDGQKVRQMIDAIIIAGNQLLLAIDGWIAAHSRQSPKQPDQNQ